MKMEMPQAGPAHAQLARMSGHWRGQETMMPSPWSPKEERRTGILQARVLEGFFVVSDYEQLDASGATSFRGHGVYSYDPHSETYKMYWFDSMGGPGGVAEGRLEGDELTFENSSPMGRHRYRYTFGDGTLRFEMSMAPDGQAFQTLMVGEYRPA